MDNKFQQKQAEAISKMTDYADKLSQMTVDNSKISEVCDKVTEIISALKIAESVFDKFNNADESYGIQAILSTDDYLNWLIDHIDKDRQNNDWIRVLQKTLSLLMCVFASEMRVHFNNKANSILSDLKKDKI